MAAQNRALSFTFTTEDQQALAALRRMEKGFKGLDVEVERTRKRGLDFGNTMAGLALGGAAIFSVNEFEEAEAGMRATEAVIRSTGNAAEVSAEQQAKYVDELSRMAGVDDDVVNAGANMLRTFTEIKGENFGLALGASLDYAAFKGQDLATSAEMVGKALNNPLTGMTKLAKAGVVFNDEQKETIKNFMEVGDVASAQKVILDELEKEYGGQAEAAATASGRMKVAFGEAGEAAGEVLAPALELGADVATKAAAAFGSLPAPLRTATVGAVGLAYAGPKMAEGLGTAKTMAVEAASTLKDLALQGREAAKNLIVPKSAVEGLGSADVATTNLSSSLATTVGTTAAAGGALVALGAVTFAWAEKQQKAAAEAARLDAAIQSLRDTAVQTNRSVSEVFRDTLAERISSNSMATEQWEINAAELTRAIEGGSDSFDRYQMAMVDAEVASGGGARSAVELGGFLKQLQKEYLGAADSVTEYRNVEEDLEADRNVTIASIGDQTRSVGDLTDEIMDQVDATRDLNDEMQETIDLTYSSIDARLAAMSANDAVRDAQQALTDARKEGDPLQIERRERDLTEAILRGVQATDEAARSAAELRGETYGAAESTLIQKQRLEELMRQTGFTSDELEYLGAMLDNAATERTVTLNTAEAQANIDKLLASINATIEGIGLLSGIGGDLIAQGVEGVLANLNPDRPNGGGNVRTSNARGPVMQVENLNVGNGVGLRDLQMEMRRAEQRAARKVLAA